MIKILTVLHTLPSVKSYRTLCFERILPYLRSKTDVHITWLVYQPERLKIESQIDPHTSILDIHDFKNALEVVKYVKPDITTVCVGMAASAGSMLLMAGTKGKRIALPNSKIMIHQPSGGFRGQATDMEIHVNDMMETKKRLNGLYVKHTGQDLKIVQDSMERDNFMTAEEAIEFGLVDRIEEHRK